jgi:hypothetical protein
MLESGRPGAAPSHAMSDPGYVSAGYVVVRRIGRPRYLDSAAFPERIVSASDHLAPVIPVVPAGWLEALEAPPGRFSGYADAAQGNLLWALEADLQRFGLDGALAADLSDWLTAAWARGDFHPPSAFATLEAARRFVRSFGPFPADTVLLGLSLRLDDVERVTSADEGISSVSRLPACGDAPADDGDVLGFDVYLVDEGDLQPWVRRPGALERLTGEGLRPNGWGLFDTVDSALAATSVLATDGDPWFAWRLTAYSLAAA